MNKETVDNFLVFEKKLLSDPKTFFHAFEQGNKGRRNIIFNEYLSWQKEGGKHVAIDFTQKKFNEWSDMIIWKIGEEGYAQTVDKYAPFTIDEYKNALSAVYSFMKDRPQYYKFRKLEGMFNPLRLLLYQLL